MGALLLAGTLLFAGPPGEDMLLQQLDDDFEALVKLEKNSESIRKAALLLAGTDDSDRWTQYKDALALLRQTRSKAAIPLLLKYLVLHAESGNGHFKMAEYAETLVILTGKDIPNPYRSGPNLKAAVREKVEELNKNWWTPNKDKITLDLGKMSDEEVRVVARQLVTKLAFDLRIWDTNDGLFYTRRRVSTLALNEGMDGPALWAEDLHPRIGTFLLEQAGYKVKTGATVDRDTAKMSYAAVKVLATLRRNGDAPKLEDIAQDREQNSAVRLMCLLALVSAGEDLKTKEVLFILDREAKLDRRVLAVFLLEYAPHQKDKQVAELLVKLLDDPNREIRTAAVASLHAPRPKEALPKLKKMLEDPRPGDPVTDILDLVGLIKTPEASEILVWYLQEGFKDGAKAKYRSYALWAFTKATDHQFHENGAQDENHYREAAKKALDWWEKQKQ